MSGSGYAVLTAPDLAETLDLHRELDAFLNAQPPAACTFLPKPHELLGVGAPPCSVEVTHALAFSCIANYHVLCCQAITEWVRWLIAEAPDSPCRGCPRLVSECWSIRPV